MPIYAYRCSSCGHGADVMQKLSEAPLTVCSACGEPTFSKQITAAGFQLKGSGWYATDFKNGSKAAKKDTTSGDKATETKTTENTETTAEKKTDSSDTKPAAPACGNGGCASSS